MGQLRRDPINGRWVIVNLDNPKSPADFEKYADGFKGGPCPFCYGNEHLTPPEIESIRPENTSPNSSGWNVRTVANKFPALKIEGNLFRKDLGIYEMLNGVGAHEVIVETPKHDKDLSDLDPEEVSGVIEMYCRRSKDLQNDKRFKFILIFRNFGRAAGASLEHPHTQLIALPMIPKNILEILRGAGAYFALYERCIFCDTLNQEREQQERILLENDFFVSFCPFVSRFSFEVRIMPKNHQTRFCQISPEQTMELAKIMIDTLNRLKSVLGKHSYNFIIHSAPLDKKKYDYFHWYIEIMPRLSRTAGFEWGTSFYVLETPPEVAVDYLKKAEVK